MFEPFLSYNIDSESRCLPDWYETTYPNLLLQTTPRIPSPKPSQSITIDSNIFYPLYLNHMPIPLIQWLMLSPSEDP
ncbi:hypothetical protein HZ326_12739 [Fusarium oxysporum f. sp. albedinis]|nr:hypothetical protein HZ326_12739 [Fusarium oxysporum f. sp. albedinis]